MHPHNQRLLVVAAVENPDASAFRQVLLAAPEIIMVELLTARSFEGSDLATLRIDARHHMLDRAVFSCRIHRLKHQKHRPAVLGVKFVLQLRELLDTAPQGILQARLVSRVETPGISRINVLKVEFFPVGDAVGFRELPSGLEDFLRFHRRFPGQGPNRLTSSELRSEPFVTPLQRNP